MGAVFKLYLRVRCQLKKPYYRYFLTVIIKHPEDANFGTYSSILFLSYHFAACFKVIDQ